MLLESLRGNLTLKTLEIGYNPIGEEGAKYLADVVKYDLGVSHSEHQPGDCVGWFRETAKLRLLSTSTFVLLFIAGWRGLYRSLIV